MFVFQLQQKQKEPEIVFTGPEQGVMKANAAMLLALQQIYSPFSAKVAAAREAKQ